MAKIGETASLRILREKSFGLYLDGGELGEVLLPHREVPKDNVIGGTLEVFLYTDSEDRPVATLLRPLAASLVMYAAVRWMIQLYPQPLLTNLVLAIVTGGLVYSAVLAALVATTRGGDQVEILLLRYVRERLFPVSAGPAG